MPITITAPQIETKLRWLSEINQYATDSLTLHEHSVDDLRIDPTQIKPDSEYESFHLPIQRKASYESDGIRPSEVAKDHFLSEEERAFYAKQHAEDQKILQQQQKEFEQQKNQTKSKTTQRTQLQTQVKQSAGEIVQSDLKKEIHADAVQVKATEKHVKLTTVEQRSTGEKTTGQRTTEEKTTEQKSTEQKTIEQKSQISTKIIQSNIESAVDTKEKLNEQKDIKKADFVETKEESKVTSKLDNPTQSVQEAGKPDNVATSQIVVSSDVSINQLNNQSENNQLNNNNNLTPITPIDTNIKPGKMHDGDNTDALDMLTKEIPSTNTQLAETTANTPNQSNNDNLIATLNNRIALPNAPSHQMQTISIFTFGDKPGAPGVPNLPDFLVPPHLITYETSIEINFRKIPPPQPPPPPKFIKKMLVHTESLERRTRAFLTGNFEVGTTDSSLRTARQKIRSLKSTILKSDDEVKHAEDTIHKAQSGDFINIFAPPIVEQPLYEFIEVPSQRSEDEYSDNLDRRSERGQSVQQQELENMEDYYSSKYSSRSSRRRVTEGNSQILYIFCNTFCMS